MKINILHNFIVIFLVLLLGFVSLYIIKKVFDFSFKQIELTSEVIASKLGPTLKKFSKIRALLEINIFLVTIATIFLTKKIGLYIWGIYLIIISIIAAIISYIRKELPDSLSILVIFTNKINKKNYFVNRLILIFEQFESVLFLIVATYVTLIFFTKLKWPITYYYAALLTTPIYCNLWIYFNYKLKIKIEDDTVNIRRLLAYLVLVIYVLKDTYIKFYYFFAKGTEYKMDQNTYLLYLSSIVFIALDRLLKAWTDDYKKYLKELN